MINLHERMLPTSAGVEPATSWSPVGRRIQLSHRGRPSGVGLLSTIISMPVAVGLQAGVIVCGLLGAAENSLVGGFESKLGKMTRS